MSRKFLLFATTAVVTAFGWYLVADEAPSEARRQTAQKHFQDGNFRDAYDIYRKLSLEQDGDPKRVGSDLQRGVECLSRLNRVEEVDAYLQEFLNVHGENWRALMSAATALTGVPHYGTLIGGEFKRGNQRGGGEFVYADERDRVQCLMWLDRGRNLVTDQERKAEAVEVARLIRQLQSALQENRYGREAWQYQILTDLTELPDYDDYQTRYGRRSVPLGAPVDADGNPVYYQQPESFEAARNDGERWRWCLGEIAAITPNAKSEMQYYWASFLWQQFGVQTMSVGPPPIPLARDGEAENKEQGQDEGEKASGPYAVDTLTDEETSTQLATGIKRFTLPEEYNFIRIFKELATGEKNSHQAPAFEQLAAIYTNRRQYPRAAEMWREVIARFGAGNNQYRKKNLDQIVGNWGRFETFGVMPAGTPAQLPYRYRNGKKVEFKAQRLDVEQLLTDVKDYIKSVSRGSARPDYQKMNIGDIGDRVVRQNQKKYVQDTVAEWSLDLNPPAEHRDDLLMVNTPLENAGAYLVTGKMQQGNEVRIVVWLSDLAIVKKPIDGGEMVYVTDAARGTAIDKANVEFFGYEIEHIKDQQWKTRFEQFAKFTDDDGLILADNKTLNQELNWLMIARKGKSFAFYGFDRFYRYGVNYGQPAATKVYFVSDRPVYRPGDTVNFKAWVRLASYNPDVNDPWKKASVTLEIMNPRGEKIIEKAIQLDEFGGYSDEMKLEGEAMLGVYQVVLRRPNDLHGAGNFRVEEYKKPEYEVTIEAPEEPVQLGEMIPAKIEARYFFGAPVVNAKVHYKVTRESYDSRWFPHHPWDWFYEPGYWWFAAEYDWYPGWWKWGCRGPIRPWWGWRQDPPEIVMEDDVEIGPDGTVEIQIDSSLAKAVHGDQDHKYSITAEVVDQSRRTIVGQGNVLVARQPFKVFAWPDRGYYNEGDTAKFSFKAQTLDQKPVKGTGIAKLFSVKYDDEGTPQETEVERWNLDTDAQGEATLQVKAAAAGQYRLSYTLTDAKDNEIEGAYVFLVRGENFDASEFRFNDLELITDKKEYQPGEKVKLLINTNRTGATVLLFERAADGVSSKPVVLKMSGKSTTREIEIEAADRPNFFVEAITVYGGKVHNAAREVIVPPAGKIVNVDVQSAQQEYLPGKDSLLKVKFTDEEGKPFVGSTILTVYDKSVEYISGGSNVSDIREFFWKWRRHYYQNVRSSLQQYSYPLYRNNEIVMHNLGVFGDLVDRLLNQNGDRFDETRRTVTRGENKMMLGGAYAFSADGRSMAALGAAPMDEMQMDAAKAEGGETLRKNAQQDQQGGVANAVEPTIRKNFVDTAYWSAEVQTNAEGIAEVSFPLPDSLTTWKARTWTMGSDAEVGEGSTEFVTSKNLLVRLQAPRFFVQKDEVILSANVHNYLDSAKPVEVRLELEGGQLEPMDALVRTVEVAANGEFRVDWRVKAVTEGQVTVRVKGLTDEESDAMELSFPVYVHGILKTDSYTGVVRQDQDSSSVKMTVPNERRVEQSRLEVRYSPTLAGAMVDALPYLVEYPYGCTEQTLNRFLPTVITQNILKRMNLDLKAIQEKRTNLNAQEIGDDADRAKQWKRFDRNPVFDEAEVQKMVEDGVQRLTQMQLSDGGWGWFSGWGEHSWPHTTATVVHGLQVAQENGVAVVPETLNRGVQWLKNYQDRQVELLKTGEVDAEQRKNKPYKLKADNLDAFVYMVLVDAGIVDDRMDNYLYRDRVDLALYAKTLYGLALHKQQSNERLTMVIRNVDQFLVQDEENETAYLNDQASPWWYWYGSSIEANAFYLKLLCKTDPKGVKASRLVKYLLNNRKHATYWNSTRDTAYAIEALAEFLVASGESEPDMTIEVWLDGKKRKEVSVSKDDLFTFDNKFVLTGEDVEAGPHTLELKRQGKGPLYFNAYLTNFTLEDFITKAGLEVKVDRKYYKLIRNDNEGKVAGSSGQVVNQKEEHYRREELVNLAELTSGDLVEVELIIESKNDYEYLVFEDFKAAGFEPVTLTSGYAGDRIHSYREFRDEKVAIFVRALPRGQHSVTYRLRAEIPGKFSALPAMAEAMYAPELRANSDEIKLKVVDRGEE